MQIRNATIEDIKQIAEVEKKCFPPAEAAREEDFRERLSVYPNHFWLLLDGETIVSLVNGMVTDEADLRDEMYENAHQTGNFRCKKSGQGRACPNLQRKTDPLLCKIWICQ